MDMRLVVGDWVAQRQEFDWHYWVGRNGIL